MLLRTRPRYTAASTTAAAKEEELLPLFTLSLPPSLTATAEQHIHTCTYKDARLLRTYTYIMYMYVSCAFRPPGPSVCTIRYDTCASQASKQRSGPPARAKLVKEPPAERERERERERRGGRTMASRPALSFAPILRATAAAHSPPLPLPYRCW